MHETIVLLSLTDRKATEKLVASGQIKPLTETVNYLLIDDSK